MDEDLIQRWNYVVSKGDTVYHLGDFALGKKPDVARIRQSLNGNIEFIWGSHDKGRANLFGHKRYLMTIKYKGQKIVLCHYPILSWQSRGQGSWHLFGHVHGRVKGVGKSMDVGVDSWGYFPISIDRIFSEMRIKEE